MTRNAALILTVAALGLGTAACSAGPGGSPVAPTPFTSESVDGTPATTSDQARITLKGAVLHLDAQRRQFRLVVAGVRVFRDINTTFSEPPSRIIRIDERTEFWAAGHRMRRRAIENGMNCEVVGLDNGEFVLARTITLLRKDGR